MHAQIWDLRGKNSPAFEMTARNRCFFKWRFDLLIRKTPKRSKNYCFKISTAKELLKVIDNNKNAEHLIQRPSSTFTNKNIVLRLNIRFSIWKVLQFIAAERVLHIPTRSAWPLGCLKTRQIRDTCSIANLNMTRSIGALLDKLKSSKYSSITCKKQRLNQDTS